MFWIVAFAIGGRAGDSAAWVSIILAVVVIVYMFYENSRSERNLTDMRGLIDQGHRLMAEKAGTMTETAGALAERTDALMSFVGATRLQQKESVEAGPLEGEPLRFNLSSCHELTLVVLYGVARADKESRVIRPASIAVRLGESFEKGDIRDFCDIVNAYFLGILSLLTCILEPDRLVWLPKGRFKVNKLPNSLVTYILEQADKRSEARYRGVALKEFYKEIDFCLEKPQED
jgi:hypothetical protein